jgi:hypothetical protein
MKRSFRWFSFAGVSAANEKKNNLCALCASAVKNLITISQDFEDLEYESSSLPERQRSGY